MKREKQDQVATGRKLKEVGYAYPSSTLATQAGKGKTGCWLVRVFDASKLIAPIDYVGSCFDTREEAFAAADALSCAYGPYTMKRS